MHAGEIVALAGVDGNGQSELVRGDRRPARPMRSGCDPRSAATTSRPVGARGMLRRRGVAHIAEDRQRRGLVLDFTLAENLALREYHTPDSCRGGGWLRSAACATARADLLEEYDVRGGGADIAGLIAVGRQPAEGACIAREIASNPQLLIAAQPTRGLDVGAIEFVHSRLVEERDAGPRRSCWSRSSPRRCARSPTASS